MIKKKIVPLCFDFDVDKKLNEMTNIKRIKKSTFVNDILRKEFNLGR